MTETISHEKLTETKPLFVDTLNNVATAPKEELEERLAMETYELLVSPEKGLANLVDNLSELYRDRSLYKTFQNGRSIEEATQFATRNKDETLIEEVYTITDTYGPNNKDWQTRQYVIDRYDFDTASGQPERHKIVIDEAGDMDVYEYNRMGAQKLIRDDEEYRVAGTYVSEALLSASLNADENLIASAHELAIPVRTKVERNEANMDAKQKLVAFQAEMGEAFAGIDQPQSRVGQRQLHEHLLAQKEWMHQEVAAVSAPSSSDHFVGYTDYTRGE